MKLDAMQCPICCSSQVKIDDNYITCLSCGNVFERKQADSQMFVDLRLANSYRQVADFSLASKLYQEIIAKYPQEDLTLAYWGLLLCDQEVLMETDGNGEIFPTFYRVKNYSIEESKIYRRFYEYVKKVSPEKMRSFANRINIINAARQKAEVISKTTPPYDLFICFKKTFLDSDIITNDYDVAMELYNNLSSKYRVFFSERSLKYLPIRDFEPNIYYGLHTAKVLILICSKKEFIQSHWLKNEWTRFLAINEKKQAGGACIIPIFIDGFTPDDLPSEIAHIQGLKYGMSLLGDIEKSIENVINPVDLNAKQEELKNSVEELKKQINQEIVNKKAIEVNSIFSGGLTRETSQYALESLLKLIKINIEDLDNPDEAEEYIRKAQEIDAYNYMLWYYKLLLDFNARSKLSLVMHSNYKNSINYRMLEKYALTDEAKSFVQSITDERVNYLKTLANRINESLNELDNNQRPQEGDILKIKNLYETMEDDAKEYVVNLKKIVSNALGRMRTNRVDDFNCLIKAVDNKDYPNNDDIIKIQNAYECLQDDEKDLVKNYKQVIVGASEKMKLGKVKQIQAALDNIAKQALPDKKELVTVEKKYLSLEESYKAKIKGFVDTMTKAYEKIYLADVKKLDAYLAKLPTEKVAQEHVYRGLENMYRRLPGKYKKLVNNIDYLENYYELLVNGTIKQDQEKEIKEKNEKKKKFWNWN